MKVDRDKILKSLKLMNRSLEEVQTGLYDPEADRSIPQIFIVGPPRSGKVLTNSLLCHCLDTGYINNIVNRFWEAPLFGILLSKDVLPDHPGMSFKSRYGMTPEVWGPGEYPFFWKKWLGECDAVIPEGDVDWENLCELLVQMGHAMQQPIIHQSLAVIHHLKGLADRIENVLFIRLRRDVADNAMSILKMRLDYHGERDKWHNVRPTNYEQVKDRGWAGQIAGQLKGVYDDLDRQLVGANVIEVNYPDLCADPDSLIQGVENWLMDKGHPVERLHPVPAPFTPTGYPDTEDRLQIVDRLQDAFGDLESIWYKG
ncbi:MAG: sulfotransferase [Pseudodesulfovibrio sp.]